MRPAWEDAMSTQKHKWIVWGRGIAASPLVRGGEPTHRARYLCPDRDAEWVVEVEAEEADLDAATRYDPAVAGYAQIERH